MCVTASLLDKAASLLGKATSLMDKTVSLLAKATSLMDKAGGHNRPCA
jgi:hypothetical protein